MELITVLLAVLLAVALAALWARERERRAAVRGLGAAAGEGRAEMRGLRDAVLAASPLPVLVFDETGRLLASNEAARTTLVGLAAGDEAPLPALRAAVHAAVAGRPAERIELTVYEPTRRRYLAHIRTYVVGDGRGCAVVLDEQSEEADFREARSLFSAGVSHELRTPLARMLALVDTLELDLDAAERDPILEGMRSEIDGMRRLIEEMVMLAILESGGRAGVNDDTDISLAVGNAVERAREAASDAGVGIAADASPDLHGAISEPLLDAMLDNLIGNAVRHAGSGAHARVTAREAPGAVDIVVSDDGRGIPPEHLSHVFERFYRVEGARSGPGTGLGLALVKHIAEANGGRAEIESAQGTGTTVRVTLPTPAAARGG